MPETTTTEREQEQNQQEQTQTETFKFKVPGSEEYTQLPNVEVGEGVALKDLLGAVISENEKRIERTQKTFSDQISGLKSQIENKNMSFQELTDKLQGIEDEKLSENERHEKRIERETRSLKEQIEQATKEAETSKSALQSMRMESQLSSALRQFTQLHDPEQFRDILEIQCKPKYEEDEDGKYRTILTVQSDKETLEMSPKDAIEHMLTQDRYANQIRSDFKSGSGTPLNRINTSGAKVYKLDDWQRLIAISSKQDMKTLMQSKEAGKIVVED